MGKLMRTYGLAHSIAEGCHLISSSMVRPHHFPCAATPQPLLRHCPCSSLRSGCGAQGVFIWGMATVGLFWLSGECDDTDPAKMARCWDDTECTYNFVSEETTCPGPCPDGGVSLQRMCDIVDGALLALNLSLGPQVLVLTALVMFTSVQVACHTCCFGETTKKGAAFTCESSTPRASGLRSCYRSRLS